MRLFFRCFVPIFLLALGSWSHAATGYINDEFEITLRSGESTRHSIVRMLSTGTRIEVLKVNPQSGYSQVRTEDGRTGFVLSRFISEQPAARDRLVWTRGQLDKLKAEKSDLDTRYSELQKNRNSTESERSNLESRNRELSEELAEIRRTAANVLNIDRENKELQNKLATSDETIADLRATNDRLAARSAQLWFVLGGAAVLFGALLGFVLPRIQWRKRSRWGDL